MNNYVIYHLHSDLSNGITNIDSVTKFQEYVSKAEECGMRALGFAEHGSVFEWYHKKTAIEKAGMKYLHGVEAYLTYTLEDKYRDNYHCVLIAKNYDGFLELNKMISRSFNRDDNHFYYTPRITFDELFATSDNIIVTSACVGGVLGKSFNYDNDDSFDIGEMTGIDNEGIPIIEPFNSVQKQFIEFLTNNKHRCFLEIGHHIDEKQLNYNTELYKLSQETGLRLIAGTDTHVLNDDHAEGRLILQKSKNIYFPGEDKWDLKFKTYEELVAAYRKQNVLPEEVYMNAIENTNVLADMVETFELDMSFKYPHIYDNPEDTFRNKVENAKQNHPFALKNHTEEELDAAIEEEIDVYKKTGCIDFMLMQTYIREWEQSHGIQCGYGRGSVSGSMIAYLLGITQMDSIRFGLNFFRFCSPARVSLGDIDTDYSGHDRDVVKEFVLKDKMGLDSINSAEIITFNTIALKGAIRDVCRALYREQSPETYIEITNEISALAEENEEEARKKWKEVFKYVDIVNGTIVSVGTHPSGVLVSDLPIDERVGLCSSSSSNYPISMLNMKELDAQNFVKLDVLG